MESALQPPTVVHAGFLERIDDPKTNCLNALLACNWTVVTSRDCAD
ncbi:hypothetical protein [Octadecabacter antarcticus]|nr:hypothetical protein [Octadecabacter antarcticus]